MKNVLFSRRMLPLFTGENHPKIFLHALRKGQRNMQVRDKSGPHHDVMWMLIINSGKRIM